MVGHNRIALLSLECRETVEECKLAKVLQPFSDGSRLYGTTLADVLRQVLACQRCPHAPVGVVITVRSEV